MRKKKEKNNATIDCFVDKSTKLALQIRMEEYSFMSHCEKEKFVYQIFCKSFQETTCESIE